MVKKLSNGEYHYMDNTTFSIMGSCVSRDIFSINDCQEYIINRFIQSVSPVSTSVSPVIDMDYQDLIVEVIDNFNITSFYKRCFSLGLLEKHSTIYLKFHQTI